MITFNSEDMSEIVAYIVENNLLLSSVLTELKELPSVTVINEAKIKNYFLSQSKDNLNVVQLENGKQFSCDLLVSVLIIIIVLFYNFLGCLKINISKYILPFIQW